MHTLGINQQRGGEESQERPCTKFRGFWCRHGTMLYKITLSLFVLRAQRIELLLMLHAQVQDPLTAFSSFFAENHL